jgi:hypothetical protein
LKTALSLVLVTLLLILFDSCASTYRPGLLSKDYGIVTKADLDEEEAETTPEKFPPSDFSPFHFWQCLPSKNYFIDCKDQGPSDEDKSDHIGEPTFLLMVGDQVFNFYTRRNYGMDQCTTMTNAWRAILKADSVVCISAAYIETDGHDSFWEIDRIKSHNGEWSWFNRS